jgi:predicted DNA-binding transcriptional regulator AlpA
MGNKTPNDLIAVAEAQRLLGVSHAKIAQLIREGMLRHFPNPLDRRVKLVSRTEVLALKPNRVDIAA